MLSGTVTSPNLESIPCTFEIPESASNAVEPIGNQADFSHRKGPVCEQQLLEGASIIERNRPEASLGEYAVTSSAVQHDSIFWL